MQLHCEGFEDQGWVDGIFEEGEEEKWEDDVLAPSF